MSKSLGWVVKSDDDGRSYLVPFEQAEAFSAYLDAVYEYWDIGSNYQGPEPVEPPGVFEIHPEHILIEKWSPL